MEKSATAEYELADRSARAARAILFDATADDRDALVHLALGWRAFAAGIAIDHGDPPPDGGELSGYLRRRLEKLLGDSAAELEHELRQLLGSAPCVSPGGLVRLWRQLEAGLTGIRFGSAVGRTRKRLAQLFAILVMLLMTGLGVIAILFAPEDPTEREVAVADLVDQLTVRFGTSAARDLLVSGWGANEAEDGRPFVWSDGEVSVMALPLRANRRYRLSLRASPYHGVIPLVVSVELNDSRITQWTIEAEGAATHTAEIPADVATGHGDRLELHYSRVARPADRDSSSRDMRELAIQARSLEIRALPRAN